MKILIVRHGPAKDAQKWLDKGGLEEERPLTKKGIRKMRRAAGGLRLLEERVDVIMSSPWSRALETAKILQEAFGLVGVQESGYLLPGAHFSELLMHLGEYEEDDVVMLVGHETHLSELVAYLTSGEVPSYLYFQKGGAACLECGGAPVVGGFGLKWFLTREILEQFEV